MDGIEGDTDYVNSKDTTTATISFQQTNKEKAWNYLKKALDLAKIDQDTIGDYANAIIELDKAIKLDSNLTKAYHYKAIILNFQRDNQNSMKNLNLALKIDSFHIPSYFAKAGVCAELEDYTCALNSLNKIIKLDSTNIKAYKNRGLLKIRLGKKEDGCQDLKQAKKLGNEFDEWEISCD